MIQLFLILKRTGANIYQKDFGQIDMDESIVSGFFSAFFSFTQGLFQAEIQDMELGPYKMLFESVDDLILVVMFDKSDSIIQVQQILIEIRNVIQMRYRDVINKSLVSMSDFQGLSEIIEDLVLNTSTIALGNDLKQKYLKILDKLSAKSEILECILITIEGIPLISKGRSEFLTLIKNQMEIFWKLKGVVLDQIILNYEKRNHLFYRVNDDLILCVFIKRGTSIEKALSMVGKAAKTIDKLYPQ